MTAADLMADIGKLTAQEKAELDELLTAGLPIWVPQEGPQRMAYESQADILFYGGAAGGGKGLALDTPIATIDGWTTMGGIQVGDVVFDESGRPCHVTAATSPVTRKCFRLVFDDGSSLVADDVHRWVTFDAVELSKMTRHNEEWKAKRRMKRLSKVGGKKSEAFTKAIAARNSQRSVATLPIPVGTMRDTETLAATLRTKSGRVNHAIPVAKPLELGDADLLVPPYTLGAWLGDGSSRNGQLTGEDAGIWERIEADGFEVRHYGWSDIAHSIIGLKVKLREIGVLENKHIPAKYLRASESQRMALLQGLMDTDGHAALDGGCEFDGINERLVDGVLELALSLGLKATKLAGKAKLNGVEISDKWRVRFTTDKEVFGLQRKCERLNPNQRRTNKFRYLVSCDEVESVKTRCIAVDSASRQYLAGKSLIPTHNTDLLLGLCLTSQEHSIIFRRESVQLIGIEERMSKITGTRNGYNSTTGVWRLPGNRVMELGSVKQPEDWLKYQGRAHDMKCVGRGTMVKMADGGYKAIESIEIGEFVATMEGAREVTRTFRMSKPAVLAEALIDGVVIAKQVQSRSHRILSTSGWVCRDSLTGHDVSLPTQRHSACKSEERLRPTSELTSSTHADQCLDLVRQQEPQQGRAGCQSRSGSFAALVASVPGIGFLKSACQLSKDAQRFSATFLQALAQPFRGLLEQGLFLPFDARGVSGVLSASSPAGYQGGYWSGSRHDGEQLHADPVGGLQCLLLLDDAAQQNPMHFAAGGQGKTHERNHRAGWYDHPYTKEKRQIEAELLEASLRFSDVGEVELFDLTIDEANYYITAGGIVNSNCFDEITHFLESQFRTLIGWLRTDNPAIRQRVVCAGNPPTSSEGQWVKKFWAPWLEPGHPNPAKPGELRWYVSDAKGEDMEVPGPDKVQVGTDWVKPKSRTFIPSSVDDNIFLSSTGYKATLQSLPEPLRSQMLRGDFQAGSADPVWQVIPTEWVKAAMARWKPLDIKGPMTAIGFDVARGGIDKTTAAPRHGLWFDKLITCPGVMTNDGPKAAGFVAPLVRNGAPIVVDSIGIGSSALDFIRGLRLRVHAFVGSEASGSMDLTGTLRFRNKRAESYWRLREALDPTNTEPIALPPDDELAADLCAARYKVVTMGVNAGIQIRDKDEIRELLGRSPDKGDALAMTFDDSIPPAGLGDDAAEFRRKRGISR